MRGFAIAIAISLMMNGAILLASGKSGCITGTYLVQEGSGTQSLWTFSNDATIHVASSAQGPFNFSDLLGVWKQTGQKTIHTTLLDFNYAATPPPAAVARVDAVATFSNTCTRMQGSFELRIFTPGSEDPLDPTTDTGSPITDTFTGRKLFPF